MPLRKDRGRLRVVSTPQRSSEGRRPGVAPVTCPRRLPSPKSEMDLVLGLALAIGEVAEARAHEGEERTEATTTARRCAERRLRDVRARLTKRLGPSVVGEFTSTLLVDGGLALRAIRAAGAPMRGRARGEGARDCWIDGGAREPREVGAVGRSRGRPSGSSYRPARRADDPPCEFVRPAKPARLARRSSACEGDSGPSRTRSERPSPRGIEAP